ncbi:uncharacterized protein LOC143273128 isoform X3 [Peromyscus maniculatus bairdii]|uniref:uncharacterized protein LOC143273128 isoform X3 n=1 Tax=Peromyscus maniculatus bairdii TaxID=230844 RepID=UPI003FD0DA8C
MSADQQGTDKFVYMVYYNDRFSYVEPFFHPWDEAYLSIKWKCKPDLGRKPFKNYVSFSPPVTLSLLLECLLIPERSLQHCLKTLKGGLLAASSGAYTGHFHSTLERARPLGHFTEAHNCVKMTDNIFLFEGIRMVSDFFSVESLSFAQNFLVKDDDVIIVSYPRSGTHWMIEMVSLIVSKGDPTWVQTVKNFARSPGLEYKDEQKLLLDQDGPRLMSTHLPIQLFPKSYFTSSAKVIYVIRNPRDVVISYYHIRKHFHLLNNQQTFDEYLPAFIQGDVVFGSWFDHTLGWLTRKDTENFLLMSYEELQRASVGTGRISSLWLKVKPLTESIRRRCRGWILVSSPGTCYSAHGRSEVNSWESILPLLLCGSRVVRLDSKCLHPLSHISISIFVDNHVPLFTCMLTSLSPFPRNERGMYQVSREGMILSQRVGTLSYI